MVSANVVLSFMLPPAGLLLGCIGLQRNIKHWKSYILCIALFIGALAYAYVPTGSSDLVRYIENFEMFGQKSFFEAVTYEGRTSDGIGSGLYALYAFYWLVGKIGDYHLAPAITTFVIYYIGMYITCDVSQKVRVRNKYTCSYLIFVLLSLNFGAIVNNIRNIFAFSLICMAVYRELCQHKRDLWTYLMYFVAVFFHPSGLFFIALRVLVELPKIGKIVAAFVLLTAQSLVNILYTNMYKVSSGNFLINLVKFGIQKAYSYYNDTSSRWGLVAQNSGSLRLSRMVYILIAVIFFACILMTLVKKKHTEEELILYKKHGFEKLLYFTLFASALTVSCVDMLTPEYWRFASALIICGGGAYLYIMAYENRKIIRLMLQSILILMPICTLLWVRSLLNSANLKMLIIQPFFSSPIIVFFLDFLKGMGIT